MNRILRWLLLAAFLIVVGMWPTALAPVTLALAGAGAILATVPASVWLAVGVIAWLKHKPSPAKATA